MRAIVGALELKPLDHARLDDARVQRQQHQLRVETVAGHQRRLDPPLDRERKLDAVDAGEGLVPDHAIGDDLGRRAVDLRRRIVAVRLILEQRAGRELHRFRAPSSDAGRRARSARSSWRISLERPNTPMNPIDELRRAMAM